ncbi:MAG: alpha/beta fold hydrolase [Ktedonobacterales bacterium]
MPTMRVNGANIAYEESGGGRETILFAHGLLWDGYMFHKQVAALRDRYRCVTLDFRGQGKSEVTRNGYDMDTLTVDTTQLIERLGHAPVHVAGLSMGGFIAMRLAARRPELVRSLILMETSAEPEPTANVPKYRMFYRVARLLGPGAVSSRVMPIMFGQSFLTDPARAAEREEWRKRASANHRVGIGRATEGVIARRGVIEEIGTITAPTLIIVGDQDVATVPEKAQHIHERIAGSRLVVIPRAGHTSTIEEPEAVTAAIEAFLDNLNR